MRTHCIASRPHLQGDRSRLRLRHSARGLTDGGGLVLLRRVWDALRLGGFLDHHGAELPGLYRPSLMVEVWAAFLFYGGGVLDDLRLLGARGVRWLFGWRAIPDPTSFGRWLRGCGERLVPVLDELLWRVVAARWRRVGPPRAFTLVLDSTVVVRYGEKQAGAQRGYRCSATRSASATGRCTSGSASSLNASKSRRRNYWPNVNDASARGSCDSILRGVPGAGGSTGGN